tara:strand:- start:362 stop:520 length:159 start_codon:yes stop_codon:yes gene_type:complete
MSEVDDVLNISGYWTVGTIRALAIAAIPLVIVGLSAGFMRKVVNVGKKVGGN